MAAATLPRIAVFIDWQNAYKTAREAFGMTAMPNEYGNFSPYQLARILAAGHSRGATAQLMRGVAAYPPSPTRARILSD